MDKVKDINLEILSDIDQFCRENNIKYSIAFGTALGAVRHGGFIPWDDDIDVDMHIDEYFKFEKAWNKKGNKEKYFLQTKKNDPNISSSFFRLRMNNTTSMERDAFDVPMHWGIPLDIFPYYSAPNNKLVQKIMRGIFRASQHFSAYNHSHPKGNRIARRFTTDVTIFLMALLAIISKFSNASVMIYFACGYENKEFFVSKDILLPPGDVGFENITLMGPKK